MLHWCLQLGVAPRVLDALRDLIADELDHATLSRAVHEAAGGQPAEVTVPRERLSFEILPHDPLERRALAAALQEYAFHETIALEAFRAMRQAPLRPRVRDAVARIFRDEARHRRLGWTLLDSLLGDAGAPPWLHTLAPRALAQVEAVYAGAPEPTPEERTWGLLGPLDYARALRRSHREIRARLARRGLGLEDGPPTLSRGERN